MSSTDPFVSSIYWPRQRVVGTAIGADRGYVVAGCEHAARVASFPIVERYDH